MASIKSAIKYLEKAFPDVMETAVFNKEGNILYSSNNWSIENEVRALLSVWWSENAQFININGVRYSILQMEPERFVATNRKKQGHLVGAATPSMNKFLIAHISPKSKGWFHGAYPTIARAAAMIETGLEINIEKGNKQKLSRQKKDVRDKIFEEDYFASFIESANNPSTSLVQQRSEIDPNLEIEVETFLEWIKDPEGLAGFIKYYLRENDSEMISRLSRIYQQFYKTFYG